jgi:hypothetical protein
MIEAASHRLGKTQMVIRGAQEAHVRSYRLHDETPEAARGVKVVQEPPNQDTTD